MTTAGAVTSVSPAARTGGGVARYDALDALRGVSAVCVCLFHFKVNSPIADIPFIKGSWLFVDFFFVLSGFVIAANYRDRLSDGMPIGDFALLRLARVYPLHVVMLLVFIAMELAGMMLSAGGLMKRQPFDDYHSVASIFTNLALVQSFGIEGRLTWNHPSWSIATEFWTYLLFACAARWARSAIDWWLALAAFACETFLLVHGDHGINVTHDWGMVRCVYGFALGALICRWRPRPVAVTGRRRAFATGLELLTAAAVIAYISLVSSSLLNVGAPLVFAIAVMVFARQAGAVSSLLMAPPLLWLGLVSYSIYMVHIFVQSRFDDLLKIVGKLTGTALVTPVKVGATHFDLVGADPLQGTLFLPVMLALVLATAALTWRWVEKPGQDWARRVVQRRKPAEFSQPPLYSQRPQS